MLCLAVLRLFTDLITNSNDLQTQTVKTGFSNYVRLGGVTEYFPVY